MTGRDDAKAAVLGRIREPLATAPPRGCPSWLWLRIPWRCRRCRAFRGNHRRVPGAGATNRCRIRRGHDRLAHPIAQWSANGALTDEVLCITMQRKVSGGAPRGHVDADRAERWAGQP